MACNSKKSWRRDKQIEIWDSGSCDIIWGTFDLSFGTLVSKWPATQKLDIVTKVTSSGTLGSFGSLVSKWPALIRKRLVVERKGVKLGSWG